MQILIRGDKTHTFDAQENDLVYAVKQYLEQAQSVPAEEQVIFANGRPLEDDEILADCVANGEVVEMHPRLHGGKVHGSLARAGKVKGQTPKVDKQEKKKKATGRAKRRLQYNRRFVNAVRTPGRRRGPNANVQA